MGEGGWELSPFAFGCRSASAGAGTPSSPLSSTCPSSLFSPSRSVSSTLLAGGEEEEEEEEEGVGGGGRAEEVEEDVGGQADRWPLSLR